MSRRRPERSRALIPISKLSLLRLSALLKTISARSSASNFMDLAGATPWMMSEWNRCKMMHVSILALSKGNTIQ